MKKVLVLLLLGVVFGNSYGRRIEEMLDSVRVLLPQTQSDSLMMIRLTFMSDYFLRLHELDSVVKYGKQSVRFGRQVNNDKAVGSGLFSLSTATGYQGRAEEAMLYALGALEAFKRADHLKGQAVSLNAIGKLYHDQADERSAITCFRKARDLRIEVGDTIGWSQADLYLLNAFVILHQRESVPLDSAERYANEAYDLATQYKGTRWKAPVMSTLEGKAIIHALKGERREAIALYEEVLERYRQRQRVIQIPGVLKQLGKQYFALGDYSMAEKYYQQALEKFEEIGSSTYILDLQLNLSDLHYAQGKVDVAFQELRNYHAAYDSVVNSTRNDQLVELEAKYETEKKEQQIELLEEQFKVSELEKERQAIFLALAVIAALLAILLFTLVFIFQRSRNRRNRLELERKLLRAQMNPHFIFNALSSIQRLYIEGDIDLANDFMSDFANLLREILDATGKQKVSVRDEIKTLRRYLKLEEARLKGKLTWELNVDEEIDQQIAMMPPLIIQPFVENAIWHGIVPKDEPGHIKIDLLQIEENLLLCKVVDDGVGLDAGNAGNKLHESKGIKLSEMRLGRGNAVQIGPAVGGGVVVTLQIDIDYENQSSHH